ncbi:HAD-IIB family hydrolase [Roseiconus nitratireducens]|uniref:HAD-IIB family hydrolase n=1 Tax=Roseiconus nitratireducens TaxID=2605748 RepID=A0A5M6CV14_9BACT|nr:HAD-IIB family hydrolase [Roseiconus nitratireducens]KAA5539087.1 HAD-IIB family hydrolase [Roseiconus nitratireducens]
MQLIQAFATDLDGTLIPLDNNPAHFDALEKIQAIVASHRLQMLFVTGRSFDLTRQAMETYRLPTPNAILCDVGTRLMCRDGGEQFRQNEAFRQEMVELRGPWGNQRIRDEVTRRGFPITPQVEANQTEVKCSFDFDVKHFARVQSLVHDWISDEQLPLKMTISVDPFTGGGLLDLLPAGADKAFGLSWWCRSRGIPDNDVVFAGDSGNDTAAINGGANAIIVGNAADSLIQAAQQHHGDRNTLFKATEDATAGVLQGLTHFLDVRGNAAAAAPDSESPGTNPAGGTRSAS